MTDPMTLTERVAAKLPAGDTLENIGLVHMVLSAIEASGTHVVVELAALVEAMTYPFPEPRSVKSWRFTWEHSIAPRFRALLARPKVTNADPS